MARVDKGGKFKLEGLVNLMKCNIGRSLRNHWISRSLS